MSGELFAQLGVGLVLGSISILGFVLVYDLICERIERVLDNANNHVRALLELKISLKDQEQLFNEIFSHYRLLVDELKKRDQASKKKKPRKKR